MQYTFNQGFSNGSCLNICGKNNKNFNSGKEFDCSCSEDCMEKGECCKDYHSCLSIFKENSTQKDKEKCFNTIANCDFCTNTPKYQCAQCKEGMFLRAGECWSSCEGTDRNILSNKICVPKIDCLVENCEECWVNNYRCKKCESGFFKYDNQCLKECPMHLIADRINNVCVEPQIYSYYYVFPSKNTCFKNCGSRWFKYRDCSCDKDCTRRGDCCFDIEQYCPKFIFWK